jgi:hypothetical protein
MCLKSPIARRLGCRQAHTFYRISIDKPCLNGRQTRASCEAAAHNVTQRQIFDRKAAFFAKPLPPEIENKLKRIVSAVPDIVGRRIIDAGSGISACFIFIAVATQKTLASSHDFDLQVFLAHACQDSLNAH